MVGSNKKTSNNAGARRAAARPPTRSSRRPGRSSPRSGGRNQRQPFSLSVQQKALIIGIGLIFLTAVLILSLLSPNQGELTSALAAAMWQAFGWGGLLAPVIMGGVGFYLVLWGMEQPPPLPTFRLAGLVLLFLTVEAFASMTLVSVNNSFSNVMEVAAAGKGGGYVGGFLAWAVTTAVGTFGAVFTLLLVGVVATILVSGVTRADFGALLARFWRRAADAAPRQIPIRSARRPQGDNTITLPPTTGDRPPVTSPPSNGKATSTLVKTRAERKVEPKSEPAVAPAEPSPFLVGHTPGQSWSLPALDQMLDLPTDEEVGSNYIREQAEVIEQTLASFGAPATIVEIHQGPTITQYGVEPNFIEQRSGKRTKVKVGKIAGLADDLALALAARSIRIQAPVPGKGYVGIEVPNSAKALVSLRDVMESLSFSRIKSLLRLGLGQDVAGQAIAADLTAMPHLLIAGTTGSGKSVCVNGIIACLLLQNTPDDLKFIMVDPKRVELTGYNGIPHLAAPVVVDLERVVGVLQWAMREMERRYQSFSQAGARNIAEHNKKTVARGEQKLPYIVVVIDELADLMMLAPEETERGITRLAQMARATGIHMVIATQRPSVDVVTGLIKANFPARIAFAVASSTDSRVILDTTGAERLLGQGDMLFQSPDAAAPLRMQGCYVSDKELSRIIEYWRNARRFNVIPAGQAKEPKPAADGESAALPTSTPPAAPPPPRQQPLWEELQAAEAERPTQPYEDELLPEAIEMIRKTGKASTSLLQRRFRIGYTRAARLIDIMEEQGVIGPPTGTSKAREVMGANSESSTDDDEEETDS